ncbi:MAG: 1-acyl-sn-glycerol-3-phosphate acyltransferase, partial [Luteibaculum sp.]
QKLLNFLGAMPAFRPVDGFKAPLKNQESFERCDKILQAGGAIALFPEGTHFQHRKLRSFKKGVFRIWKNNTEALVVPVGLNFSSLDTSKAKVSICFGTPIPYQENLNPDNLKEALAQQLYLPENPENCDTFLNQAWSQQHVSGLIRPPFHAKKDWTYEGESFELVEKKLVLPFGFWRYASNMVIIAACTPLVLVGLLSEIPFLLVKHFVLKRFKDPQFHIAISWFLKHIWVSSLFVLGLVYWIYDGLFSFKGFMIAAILLGHLVLPLCKRSIRKIISQLRYLMLPQELKIRVDRIYQSE